FCDRNARNSACRRMAALNRRLGGDVSLNAPIRDDGDSGEWQDWLVDEVSDQETRLVEDEESDNRRKALGEALSVLNELEPRLFQTRRHAVAPLTHLSIPPPHPTSP